MVYRIFVEKKEELAHEAHALLEEAKSLLGLSRVTRIRLLNRYDVEGVDEPLFQKAVRTVLSEPQLDLTYDTLDAEGAITVSFLVETFRFAVFTEIIKFPFTSSPAALYIITLTGV